LGSRHFGHKLGRPFLSLIALAFAMDVLAETFFYGAVVGALTASSPWLRKPALQLWRPAILCPLVVALLGAMLYRLLGSGMWLMLYHLAPAFDISGSEFLQLSAVYSKLTPLEIVSVPIVVESAASLGILELTGSMAVSLTDVAESANITTDGARCLLEVLTFIGLLQKNSAGQFFHNWSTEALRLAVENAKFVVNVELPLVAHLTETLRSGKPAGLHNAFGSQYRSLYHARTEVPKLTAWTDMMNNANKLAVAIVLRRYGSRFAGLESLLDLCGNEGRNSMAVARAYPQLQITVHDLPAVIQDPERGTAVRIKRAGLDKQISVFPWDLSEAGEIVWPRTDFHAVQLVHCVNEWPPDEFKTRLREVARALRVGGHLLIIGSYATSSSDINLQLKLGRSWLSMPYFIAGTQEGGTMYDVETIQHFVEESGYVNVKFEHLWETVSAITGQKP